MKPSDWEKIASQESEQDKRIGDKIRLVWNVFWAALLLIGVIEVFQIWKRAIG